MNIANILRKLRYEHYLGVPHLFGVSFELLFFKESPYAKKQAASPGPYLAGGATGGGGTQRNY
jgi:hypothetical protein